MPSQYCKRSIDLFGQNGAREFMRHGHGGERNHQIGALQPFFRKPVVTADNEDQIMATHLGLGKQVRETIRIERLAGGVQKDLLRRGMPRVEIGAIRAVFGHGAGTVAIRTTNIVGGQSVRVHVFGLTGEVEVDLQAFRISGVRRVGRDFERLRLTPEPVEIVKAAALFGKHMHDQVGIVAQNPFPALITFNAGGAFADLLQLELNFVRNGL